MARLLEFFYGFLQDALKYSKKDKNIVVGGKFVSELHV